NAIRCLSSLSISGFKEFLAASISLVINCLAANRQINDTIAIAIAMVVCCLFKSGVNGPLISPTRIATNRKRNMPITIAKYMIIVALRLFLGVVVRETVLLIYRL